MADGALVNNSSDVSPRSNSHDLNARVKKYQDLNIFPEDSSSFLQCKIM
jgi:hypothetical protein